MASSSAPPPPPAPFRVGPWIVDPGGHALTRDGDERRVEPKVMALLVALAARPGETLSRDELTETVWADVVVSEDSLSRAVSKLRTALDDDAQAPQFVETIPKAGYRLVAPVAPIEPTPTSRERPPARRPRVPVLALIGLAAVVALGVWVVLDRAPDEPGAERVVTHLAGVERHPALSTDGRRVAFVAVPREGEQADLYVQDLDGDAPLRLTDTPENELHPTWLGDGRLAFLRCSADQCHVFAMSASGGGARRVVDEPVSQWGLGSAPEGAVVVASVRGEPDGPYRVVRFDLDSGARDVLTDPENETVGDLAPAISPDGAHLAFIRHGRSGEEDVWARSLTTDEVPQPLTTDGVPVGGFAWDGRGGIVYVATRDGEEALWRLAEAGGEPVRVSGGSLGSPRNPSVAGGTLVHEVDLSEVNLYALDSTGTRRPVVASTSVDEQPALSPSGDRVAFLSDRTGAPELWTASLAGGDLVRLTSFGGVRLGAPRWSPDGRRIAFEVQNEEGGRLYTVAAQGGTPTPVTGGPYDFGPRWGADGRTLVYGSNPSGTPEIWRLAVDGEPERLGPGFVGEPDPGGEWLLYLDPDDEELYRRPLAGGDATAFAPINLRDWGNWVVTSRGVLLIAREESTASLVRVDPETGQREVLVSDLGLVPWRVPALSASADGSVIVVALLDRVESAIVSASLR